MWRAIHLRTVTSETPKRAGNLTWLLACSPPLHNQGPHFGRCLGILVNVHGVSLEDRVASQPPQSPFSAREQPIETLHLETEPNATRQIYCLPKSALQSGSASWAASIVMNAGRA
jgi:hypothetical protein